MAFLPTNASQVQQFAVALYGIKVGSATMAAVQQDITNVGGLNKALNAYYVASFGSSTTAAVAASVAANLGLTGTAATDAAAYITAVLNGTAASARGEAIMGVLSLFSTLTSNATFGAAATAWNTKVAAAIAYTGAADASVAAGSVAEGQVFTLTASIDSLVGGTGNDTFVGDSSTGVVSKGDQINGGAGTDTLKLYATTTLPALTSIESLEIYDATAASTDLSSSNLGGVTSLTLNGYEAVDAVGITIKQGDTVSIIGGRDATVGTDDVNIGGAATVTSATVNVTSSGTSATAEMELDFTGTGMTSVTVNALGSTKSWVSILAGTAGVALTTATINATSELAISDIEDATTVNAAASTGKVTLSTAVNKVTVTGGTAADSITLAHANTVAFEGTINGGDGDDTVVISSLNGAADLVDSKVTLNGGAGSNSLTMVSDLAIALGGLTTANFAKKGISNFQTLNISDAVANSDVINVANFTGVTTVDYKDDRAATSTLNGLASGGTVKLSKIDADGALTVNVKDADVAGSNADELTIVLNATHADATTDTDFNVVTAANVETINIVSGTNKAATLTLTTAANIFDLIAVNARNINVTGSVNLDLTNDPLEDTVEVFNASALTGTLKVSLAGANGGVLATGSATKANTITGSSFADVIIGGAGVDTIDGGAGQDRITLGAGVDIVNITTTDLDTIQDFVFGATGDRLDLDESAFGVIIGGDGADDVANTDAVSVREIGAQVVLSAGNNIFVVTGEKYADVDAMEVAIEANGGRQLTFTLTTTTDDDIFVLWADTTGNSYLSVVSVGTGGTTINADAEGTNLVKLVGVDVSVAGTVNNANFALI